MRLLWLSPSVSLCALICILCGGVEWSLGAVAHWLAWLWRLWFDVLLWRAFRPFALRVDLAGRLAGWVAELLCC